MAPTSRGGPSRGTCASRKPTPSAVSPHARTGPRAAGPRRCRSRRERPRSCARGRGTCHLLECCRSAHPGMRIRHGHQPPEAEASASRPAALLLLRPCAYGRETMTEQQPYELVQRYADFELRRYPAHVVAEVEVSASFDRAGNAAFRHLFNYISGDNTARQSVAMTAPVVQGAAPSRQASSEKVPMTAPVLQSRSSDAAPAGGD